MENLEKWVIVIIISEQYFTLWGVVLNKTHKYNFPKSKHIFSIQLQSLWFVDFSIKLMNIDATSNFYSVGFATNHECIEKELRFICLYKHSLE